MADQEFQTPNQDNEKQNTALLLQNYRSIAAQLQASTDLDETREALMPIESQSASTQIAFLKELAKEQTIEAANITQAIHALGSSKEVRKEARRRLLQLEASNIYASWTPPENPKLVEALENAIGVNLADDGLISELESILTEGEEHLGQTDYQMAAEAFLEQWSNQEFESVYDLLAQESPLKEGLSQKDWADKRTSWATTTQPNDFQVMFITSVEDESISDQQQLVDVGWSIQFATIQPLTECPQPVINFTETGRVWYWLRYTMVQENDQWLVQTISDEATAAIKLPTEELIQKIHDNNTQLQKVAEAIDAEEEDDDDDDDDLDGNFVDATLVEVDTRRVVIEEQTDTVINGKRIIEDIIAINANAEDEEDEDDDEDEEEEFEHEMDLFSDALDHMDSMVRLVTQSLHYYDAIFAQDPVKHSELYKEAFNLASTIFDVERATVYAQQASERVPEERSDALRNLAISYQALAIKCHNEDNHEEEARFDALIEPTLRQALAVEESPDNLITLALALIQRDKNYDEAESFLIKAQKGPLSPEGIVSIELGLGEIAMFNEEEEKAITHFKKLVKLTPDDEQVWYYLGYLHHQLEQYNEAIEALNKSIELDPELTEAYAELAGLYLTQGNQRKAREIVSLGLEENPDAADIHAAMAQIYMYGGDYRNANKSLLQAEQLDGEDEFVQLTRQRYNVESKHQLTQKKSQQKQKQNKAKKR